MRIFVHKNCHWAIAIKRHLLKMMYFEDQEDSLLKRSSPLVGITIPVMWAQSGTAAGDQHRYTVAKAQRASPAQVARISRVISGGGHRAPQSSARHGGGTRATRRQAGTRRRRRLAGGCAGAARPFRSLPGLPARHAVYPQPARLHVLAQLHLRRRPGTIPVSTYFT